MIQPIFAGLLVGLVGFASTFAVVLKGLAAVGASPDQAASGLLALLMAMGVIAIALSLWSRMPISIAWSTPGSALLVATGMPAGGFPAATGAFVLAGALIVVCGVWRPFGRVVGAIPSGLANAMLAGILFGLCTAPVKAVAALPLLALPIIAVWAIGLRVARAYAIPLAVVATLVTIVVATPLPAGTNIWVAPHPVFVPPVFELGAIVSITIPLFIVTMASQNVPGLAVLQVNGYRPAVGPIFVATGIGSGLTALLGGHTVNLAAITAALCAGPDAHPDPGRRYVATVFGGLAYIAFGLIASAAAAFVAASPPLLIESVAGLALLGSFGSSLQAALVREEERLPAVATFLIAASGASFLGIGSAFWGLVAGLVLLFVTKTRAAPASTS